MDIVVRCVEQDEFDAWLPLWEGYNAFYERSGPTALPMTVTRMTWGRFFDRDEPMECLVAEQGVRLVGLAHFIFHRSTTMIAATCYMQDLYTTEEARGQGVGRALIEGVYERARSAGSSRVYWHTHETNVTAQGLYNRIAERSGFILYRRQF